MQRKSSVSQRRSLRLLTLFILLALVTSLAMPVFAQEAAPPTQPTGPLQILEISGNDVKDSAANGKAAEAGFEFTDVPAGMSFFNETEPNDTAATANALPGSQVAVYGTISPATEVDFFSFTASAGDRVYAATMTSFSNGGSTDTVLDVIASDGTTVLETDDESGSFSGSSSAIGGTIIPAAGTYYIKVDGFSTTSTITPYHLHVRVQSGLPTAEVEPNNDTTTATPLAASGWMSGTITAIADPDLFSFSLSAGDSVYIGLDMDPGRLASNTNWNGRLGLGTFNNFFLVANDGSTTKPHAEAFFMTVQEAGTYYAYIDSTSATGLGANARYNLSVSIYPKQAQPNCTTITSTDVPYVIGPGVGTTSSTIVVPPTITSSISDINATIVLTHTNMGDLDVTLVGPTAASTALFTDIGSSTQVPMDIGLDDQAALPIGTFTVVKDIVYQPEQPGRLSTFNGTPAAGTWTLQIADDTTNTSGGRLQSWSLEVCGDPPPPYAIELNKTVGTVPAVCATTDSVTIPPGGFDVYYCYTVRNTGLNTLNVHDLVDSELGTIFTGVNYALAPGATYSHIQQATIYDTVTNTGTWTAYNPPDGGPTATDSDTATVNVRQQMCPAGYNAVTVDYSFFNNPFPPAGWTVTNTTTACNAAGAVPDWTNTNPGARANLTGGFGPFAIADSDKCGSGSSLNAIMSTGMLDFTGMISPTISFNTDYDDIGTGDDRAILASSTDGGTTWAPLFTWDSDHRGPLLVTQALPGAGENDVMVQWDYASTWDWWWEVDDAFLTACEPIPSNPAISLDKTVGTSPLVCATTDEITLPAGGGEVTYCYEVTNTGDVTLNLHDLDDSELGNLFTGLSYALAPGASAFVTETTTINVTTVNTATWTAYNAGPINVVTATDAATVTVQAANTPAINLNKTVGTVPGVCATTNKVTVPYGTEVYYCYQVENTGNVTLDVHSLVDNKLGALVTNLAYELTPGAFSPQVIVPATINITTTNVATWTASTAVPFIDISATGTALGLTDDSEANIVSPFPFTFFGSTSTDLRVGNNGGILFGVTTGDLGLSNTALPAAAGLPAPAILPFWDDMDDETGNVFWEVQGTAPDRKLIVEWYNRPHFNGVGTATFEAILYETSNAIEFRYLDTDFGNVAYNYGASATSGLQQNTTTAVQHSFNQPVLFGGKAVRFEPSAYTPQVLNLTASDDDFAEVNVTYPNIDVDPLALSATQATNTTTNQTLNVANTGNAPLTWEIAETQPDRPARAGVVAAPEPVFDVPAAVTSEKDCAAFENYLGNEPDGWAQFCGQPAEAPASSPSNPTSTGYTLNLRTPDRNLKRFTLNNWPGQTVVGAQTANIYALDFDTTATTLYALNTSTNELGTLSTTTGAFTAIVACPAPAGGTWTGLSIDPTTNVFYASTATNLYTLNSATCSPTLIGPFGVASGIMIDIAVNPAGAMYGHDIFTDSIYTINTSTGAATLVGPTGYLANFAQGMDFDNEDGTLYIFLYVGTGVNHYGTVNLATGAVTALATTNPTGEFEGATQTLGLCIPNDYTWLSTSPISGTTAATSVTPVTVTFDSTALANGVYTGQLCIRSNDPDNGPGNETSLVQVPVTLTVTAPVNPSIALTKTVGTTSGVCATTDDITVAAGTTVYYCYEVANTGDVTLNLHNLVDDQLGTIFSGLNYALAPGSSVNTVQAGLSIPAVINATTVNTATWTAYNAGPINVVTATDTATVTVQAAGPAINLVKTVGTVPAVCATTDNIVVTAGTPVYYCYQVENTGTVTFNYHDLVDSELGTLLNDFPYTLAPGAFSPQVIIPDTPMATVTNVGTWTAMTALSGYTADDTIPYNWEDISGTGTAVTLTDDSVSGALPIGFSFDFFGTGYTNAYASSNGFMTFASGSGNGCCSGQALPNPAAPNNLVAGWWEDLNPSAGGTVHYQTLGTAPNRVFILQFTNIPHYSSGNDVTMQWKLFETSNAIEVHYQAAPSDGGTHSAGIENATGTVGVQYYYGTSALTTPKAVRYALTPVQSATDTDTATVTVLTPNIDVTPLSLSETHLTPPQVTTKPLTVANTGQGNLTWQIAEEPTARPPEALTGGDAAVAADVVDPSDLKPQEPPAAPAAPSDWRAPEAVLYDNGPLVTHPGGGAGGADASALQTALLLSTYGFGNQVAAGNRVADDFTVGGGGWLINTITFFGYQTGSTTTSTFTALNLRIWDGPPNDPTSMVVFGDTTTNRLASSTWSNSYRVLDTGLLDSTRPIMANVATVNTFLPAGTYWLDWQADGSLASGPWAPPVSILGQTGKPGANALQYTSTGWASLIDTGAGTVQDLPFIVDGLADCSNISNVPWLSASPTSGTNAGGTNTPVTVTFDSASLADGVYTANLCVTSNDPDLGPGNGTNLVIVPVTLAVGEPTAVTLGDLTAAPASAGLPIATLPAAAGLALAAVYALRRKR